MRGLACVEMNVLMAFEPHVAGGLVSGQIVENDMDLARRISGDHPVHEIEELDAATSLIGRPTTSPLPTLSAANSVVVPCRL